MTDLNRSYPTRDERLQEALAALRTSLNPSTRRWARCLLAASAERTPGNAPTLARQIAVSRRKARQAMRNLKAALERADFTCDEKD